MSQSPQQPTSIVRYVWLVYLGALFFPPVFDPTADALDWLAAVGLIAAFLPIYAATFRTRNDRQMVLLVGLLAVLSLAGSLVNSGASVFVIYAAAAAGGLYPTRKAVAVVAALAGVVAVMIVVSPDPTSWRLGTFVSALVFTMVVGATSIFDAERGRASRALLRADEEIERLATIAERERIARDLHDLLGHTLSVVVLKSELAARLVRSSPDQAATELTDIERIGREALGEVRAAVAGYRARGLLAELDGACVALRAAGLDVEVHADPTDLRPEQESALAMALREAVTNVVRHAGAERAGISITADESQVRLRVTDDGRGPSGQTGFGITGMHERIAALGGLVEVGGARGRDNHGTTVEVTLPLVPASARRRPTPEAGGH